MSGPRNWEAAGGYIPHSDGSISFSLMHRIVSLRENLLSVGYHCICDARNDEFGRFSFVVYLSDVRSQMLGGSWWILIPQCDGSVSSYVMAQDCVIEAIFCCR
jgi:hypothetical protein